MSPHDLAQRFYDKGVQDLHAVYALLTHAEISDDIIGFHCQQAVEKFMKAVLADNHVVFRKTHDLIELLSIFDDHKLSTPKNREALDELEPYAVSARYDFFDEPINFDRKFALETVEQVREWAERNLGLK